MWESDEKALIDQNLSDILIRMKTVCEKFEVDPGSLDEVRFQVKGMQAAMWCLLHRVKDWAEIRGVEIDDKEDNG